MSTSVGKVFLTGASGFVGSHIAAQLLVAGYAIKATFRSEAKSNSFKASFPGQPVETVIVPDITAPGAYGDSLNGVDFVIHCASPFTFAISDIQKDLLDPAIKGTTEILKAIEKTPSVKRVVVTSSFAAVIDPFKGPRQGYSYTEDDWNPLTKEQALESKLFGYQASKTFAERAAWDFIESQKKTGSTLSLVTICPPMIFGPVHPAAGITAAHPNESSAQLLGAINTPTNESTPTRMPVFADVRDVGKAHVAALDPEKVPFGTSERFVVCGGKFTWDGARDIAKGGKEASEESMAPAQLYYSIDSSKMERVLGIKWTAIEDSVADCVKSLNIKS